MTGIAKNGQRCFAVCRKEAWGVAGQARLFFMETMFPAEGVAKAPQGQKLGGDYPRSMLGGGWTYLAFRGIVAA